MRFAESGCAGQVMQLSDECGMIEKCHKSIGLLPLMVVVISSLILVRAAFVRRAVPTLIVAPLSKGRGKGQASQQAEHCQGEKQLFHAVGEKW